MHEYVIPLSNNNTPLLTKTNLKFFLYCSKDRLPSLNIVPPSLSAQKKTVTALFLLFYQKKWITHHPASPSMTHKKGNLKKYKI